MTIEVVSGQKKGEVGKREERNGKRKEIKRESER